MVRDRNKKKNAKVTYKKHKKMRSCAAGGKVKEVFIRIREICTRQNECINIQVQIAIAVREVLFFMFVVYNLKRYPLAVPLLLRTKLF
mgnify:CR=1 FL=1